MMTRSAEICRLAVRSSSLRGLLGVALVGVCLGLAGCETYMIVDGGRIRGEDAIDNSRIEKMLGIKNFERYPTMFLLDRQGRVDIVEAGFSLHSLAMLKKRIEKLLEE